MISVVSLRKNTLPRPRYYQSFQYVEFNLILIKIWKFQELKQIYLEVYVWKQENFQTNMLYIALSIQQLEHSIAIVY